jgi:hypothetical protein
LPGSCGPAGGFDTQGVTVSNISDSFAKGHIDINGSVSKSGFCYDANGTFHGTITFSISGTTLTPNLNMDQPTWMWTFPGTAGWPLRSCSDPMGIALLGITEAVASKIATSLAGDALKNAPGWRNPPAPASAAYLVRSSAAWR